MAKPCRLGDHREQNDTIISLKTKLGKQQLFKTNFSLLATKSSYFAHKLSDQNQNNRIEIQCSELDFDHKVKLLKLLLYYHPKESIFESLNSVKSAIGVLESAVDFQCEEIVGCCVQYLEAIPWEEREEEEIIKAVKNLGPVAMPILARVRPADISGTKRVFLSAIRFATSMDRPCPPFGNELKTSAQEQVEYMLGEDEDLPLIVVDEEVKSTVRTGLSRLFESFQNDVRLIARSDGSEAEILSSLSDLEWVCNILPKMDLMKDFVSQWVEISGKVLEAVEDQRLESLMWGLKFKLVEIAAKVLDAVGYGNVILSAQSRVKLLKNWLPFIRKIKPLLDSKGNEDISFGHKMDEDLCQSIEGAIVSLVLSLPSNDQADVFGDWMKRDDEQVRYPDLSEAFEIWCFRTKSAKRRLMGVLDKVGNATITL